MRNIILTILLSVSLVNGHAFGATAKVCEYIAQVNG